MSIMEKQESYKSPYEGAGDTEPRTEAELKEAKEAAYVVGELEAALRGLRFAVDSGDEMLFNSYRGLLPERFSKKVAELSASEEFENVTKITQEVRALVEEGKRVFNIEPQTEALMEQKIEKIDSMAPKDFSRIISETVGREVVIDRTDRNLIKDLAIKFIRATSGKAEVKDVFQKGYELREDAKRQLSEGSQKRIPVIDKNLTVYWVRDPKDATEQIIKPVRK